MKILLLSTIYPLPEGNKGTYVCHYFTREWVKMGHDVRVVHIQATFPRLFYLLARMAQSKIAAKTGAVVYTKRLGKAEKYEMDGVSVIRIPVYKPIPHGRFTSKSIKRAVETIFANNKAEGYEPDLIIGHFPNPQIELLSLLKKEYPQAKTCIVMHGEIDIMKKVYGARLEKLMHDIDIWGFRSKTVKEDFDKEVAIVKNPFICYSGIPETYITTKNTRSFNGKLRNFVYVGLMIDRKYPEKVLDAVQKVYKDDDYHITYIGEGKQLGVVKERVLKYDASENVTILGRIPREKIVDEYDKADCMVMISKNEAYGLVYLEAMARGCITISSKREGFDGVIVDGENGFLCNAGDADELAGIIKRINALTSAERQRISDNAIATAKRLTDFKAAKMYIDDVIERAK